MEVDNVNPSEINSFLVKEIRRADVIDLNKKRKLQAEHLGLPLSKVKCSEGSFSSKSPARLDEVPEVEDLRTNVIKGGATDDGYEHESANFNSYTEDSGKGTSSSPMLLTDSSMSVLGESKFQAENRKSWSFDRPSSSSLNWDSNSIKGHVYSSDSAAATEGGSGKEQFNFVGEEHHASHHVEGLDDHLTEYGSLSEYLSSGYSHGSTEQFTEKEIEESLYSNEGNQNVYVLSSGRRSVNQETQCGKKQPTIDQEFEQYFSSLML